MMLAKYETYNVVKQGVIIKQYSSDDFTLNLLNSIVVIQDKNTRRTHCILSPNSYDYIEVESEEIPCAT